MRLGGSGRSGPAPLDIDLPGLPFVERGPGESFPVDFVIPCVFTRAVVGPW